MIKSDMLLNSSIVTCNLIQASSPIEIKWLKKRKKISIHLNRQLNGKTKRQLLCGLTAGQPYWILCNCSTSFFVCVLQLQDYGVTSIPDNSSHSVT